MCCGGERIIVKRWCRTSAANTPRTQEAMQRLAASATRFLSPARRWPPRRMARLTESPLGGTWVLDALRAQLGVSPAMRKLLKGRLDDSAESAVRPGRQPGAGTVVQAGRRQLDRLGTPVTQR